MLSVFLSSLCPSLTLIALIYQCVSAFILFPVIPQAFKGTQLKKTGIAAELHWGLVCDCGQHIPHLQNNLKRFIFQSPWTTVLSHSTHPFYSLHPSHSLFFHSTTLCSWVVSARAPAHYSSTSALNNKPHSAWITAVLQIWVKCQWKTLLLMGGELHECVCVSGSLSSGPHCYSAKAGGT